MRRVEARRLKLGLSKSELAAELGTTTDALRAWMTGAHGWTTGDRRQAQHFPQPRKTLSNLVIANSEHMFKIGP